MSNRPRPHGGGYLPGQEDNSPVAPDLTELHTPPYQSELPTGGSYEISEMPSHEPPVELGVTSQTKPEVIYQQTKIWSRSNDSISKVNSKYEVSQQSSNSLQYQPPITYKEAQATVIEIFRDDPPLYSSYLSDPPSARPTRHLQRGRWNCFSPSSNYRWKKHPHVFKSPNVKPDDRSKYRHRDSMARVYYRPGADRYLDSEDGSLKKLMVQTVDDIYNSTTSQQHAWRRTYIRKIGPYMLRAAYWPLKTIPAGSLDWTVEDKWMIALRWLPSCLVLFFVLPLPKKSCQVREGLAYFPFPYKYWGTCKVARNPKEDVRPSRALHWNASVDDQKEERILRPTYLMFLKNPTSEEMSGYERKADVEWNGSHPEEHMKFLPYVFVAYTKDQFTEDRADMDALLHIAEKATRRAGLSAFWIGCSCMPDPANIEEDVYRINDVIRGARSLVIAVGHRRDDGKSRDTASLLREWGSRMWTFPEALLSPSNKNIEIYTRGTDLNRPWVIAKKDLPARAWADADLARQLMDHFQGTLTLSRLELVGIAMRCLHARRTDAYLPGDMAYALMGLLRRRPMVDRTDSEFQALARLSLANDNDLLLERLICVLPKTMDHQWLRADDAWDINLWDIYPTCQIAGIGDCDTVILDGCRAATIKWDEFEPVYSVRRRSGKRWFARFMVRISPILIIIGGVLANYSRSLGYAGGYGLRRRQFGGDSTTSTFPTPTGYGYGSSPTSTSSASSGGPDTISSGSSLYGGAGYTTTTVNPGFAIPAAIFLLVGLTTWLASPYLVKIMYGGKFWDQQAWLFGLEGYADIATIESLIFGYNMKRLSWSTCGSPLSRHSVNEHKEWIGRDPTDDPAVAKIVEEGKKAAVGEMRVFTIVDTYTMTVTLVQATRPPVAVLLVGSEGGRQRGVLCSYEWETQTLFKESVVRMETQVIGRMERIGRVNFGFFRSGKGGEKI